MNEPITKAEAKKLGLMPKTNYFSPFETDLLKRMFADISKINPEATIVRGDGGRVCIWVKEHKVQGRNDSPKAMRGKYPPVKDVVGRIGIRN